MSTNERYAKLGQNVSGRGHVTYFGNFGLPSISRKLLELETSTFACRFITKGTNEINAKLGQKGSRSCHVTIFLKFWDPLHISGTVRGKNVKFGMQIYHQGS